MASGRRFGAVYRKLRRDGTEYDGWYVRWREAGRRMERGGFLTEEDAETFLASRRVERSTNRALGMVAVRRIAVKELGAQYLAWARANRRPSTAATHRAFLLHLTRELGTREAQDVRPEDILRVLTGLRQRAKPLAVSTVHTALTAFSAAFTWAVENRHARTNPCHGLRRRLPKIDVDEPPYLTHEELEQIYAAVPAEIRPVVALWGEAGLRFSEACGLRWSEVARDFGRVALKGERSKGHRGRTVPLTELARGHLQAARARHAVPLWGGAVFPDLTPKRVAGVFRAAMAAIGRTDVTPHTLRHAFCSALIRAGVDIEQVRRLAGHRSILTTQRYSCHAPGNAGDLAIQQLERARHGFSPRDASQSRNAT